MASRVVQLGRGVYVQLTQLIKHFTAAEEHL